MSGKVWWKSKTLWVNALAVVGCVGVGAFGLSAEQWGGISTGVLAVVNVVLRLYTGEPLAASEE